MKKFFEKHDLIKLASLFVLLAVILSWVLKSGQFSAGELTTSDISRVGIFDLGTYSLLGFYYFTAIMIFIFVVAGFYKVLNTLPAYKKLTSNIASKFDGKEKILVVISILVYGCLASVLKDYIVLLTIIPLSISIMSKLKIDKISALSSTFGGILIGLLGSLYSGKAAGLLADASVGIGVKYGYELISVIVLFVIAIILLTYFVFARLNKKIGEPVKDIFAEDEETKAEVAKKVANKTEKAAKKTAALAKDNGKAKKVKVGKINTIPLIIILVLTVIIALLAMIDWTNVFKVTAFADAYTWLTEATVFDVPIFSYILGNIFAEFGKWDLFSVATVLIVAVLIIKIIYHISFDTIIEKFGEGFKAIGKTVIVMLIIHTVLVLSVFYPVIPGIVKALVGSGKNVLTSFLGAGLASIFTVDFQFTLSMIGSYYAKFSDINVAALTLQTAFGFVNLIAPTSIVLMLGLSMLDIKYKDWFKFIWKFMLLLALVIAAIFLILYLV